MGDHPRPIYPWTSSGGRRRLWDLPVGESHHLSNTYPPEIWERIQVLHWRKVLTLGDCDLGSLEEQVSEYCPARPAEVMKLIGLGIEFIFQKETLPELNVRTKLRGGGFRQVGIGTSASRQAVIARRWMGGLFPILLDYWKRLEAETGRHSGPALHTLTGSVVFPSRIFDALAKGCSLNAVFTPSRAR